MTFTVYSKDGCPYCTKVVQVLQLACSAISSPALCRSQVFKIQKALAFAGFRQQYVVLVQSADHLRAAIES